MQTLNDISPYWLCDPTMADARLEALNQAVYGRADMDASLSHADPWSPIPVVTDAGLGGEHTRLATLFQLPFPYMPADRPHGRPHPTGAKRAHGGRTGRPTLVRTGR